MDKKTTPSIREFEIFKSEKEKSIVKMFFIGNIFFLFLSFIGQLTLHFFNWFHFLILVGGNIIIFSLLFLVWLKNLYIRFLKYAILIGGVLLITLWIYFMNPRYAWPVFTVFAVLIIVGGGIFFETKISIISFLSTIVAFGFLVLHYSKIGTPFTIYEIYTFFLVNIMVVMASILMTQRIRFFLIELLEKRREAEEAKTSLEIKVKARTQELEELTKSLDEKVKERTKELQERINQLERFSKLTIGRELRMVELKKEIERLKKELEEKKK